MTQGTIEEFLEMVTYRRPHKSKGEQDFIKRFLTPLDPVYDKFGNYIITVGEASRTMFSCHTDTVHRDDGRQKVCYDGEFGMAYKDDNEALGADDAAGIWLFVNMIRRGVAGTYIFHRGEECGGLGSEWRAETKEEWARKFDRSIAFDRKGTTSIITHQGGDRCCSDDFGRALIEQFGAHGLPYELDTGGVFTDTANYTHLIPECTNISVGYIDEHRPSEMQDTVHLAALLEACCLIDWEKLPVMRTPVKKWTGYYGRNSKGFSSGAYSGAYGGTPVKVASNDAVAYPDDDSPGIPFGDIAEYVYHNPDEVAGLIFDYIDAGLITADDFPALFACRQAELPLEGPVDVTDDKDGLPEVSMEELLAWVGTAEAELDDLTWQQDQAAADRAFEYNGAEVYGYDSVYEALEVEIRNKKAELDDLYRLIEHRHAELYQAEAPVLAPVSPPPPIPPAEPAKAATDAAAEAAAAEHAKQLIAAASAV